MLALEDQIRALESRLREARRTRDPAAKLEVRLLRLMEARQLVVRRVVDVILFTTISKQTGSVPSPRGA